MKRSRRQLTLKRKLDMRKEVMSKFIDLSLVKMSVIKISFEMTKVRQTLQK